ncbi:MAG: hypothetical protein M3O33_10085 [Cyanobacteriota bacterium]|nr:hypothetical protein [Cyanobacteriota bacterium]
MGQKIRVSCFGGVVSIGGAKGRDWNGFDVGTVLESPFEKLCKVRSASLEAQR